MTETQKPNGQHCRINACYGLVIALTGLIASFLIAWIMLWFGMRTSSDLVAVIGAFTSVTGTLTGYFFGQKIESANRENTENRLSESMADLSFEKTKNTEIIGKLHGAKSKNETLCSCVNNDQNVITKAQEKKSQWDKRRMEQKQNKGVPPDPPETVINDIVDLLNQAKIPENVLKSLKFEDD